MSIYRLDPESFDKPSEIVLIRDDAKKRLETYDYTEIIQELRELVAEGALYWADKRLLADFFTKSQLELEVQGSGPFLVEAVVSSGKQRFSLSDCEALCRGTPPFFIRKGFLKVFDREIPWKAIKAAWQDPLRELSLDALRELLDHSPLPYTLDADAERALQQAPKAKEVFPVLRLSDRSGAFADLWMDYDGEEFPYQEQSLHAAKRDAKAESAWEADLLETDFQRKRVDKSHYYCPLDKVGKSLAFLLELGWTIYDAQNRQVHLQTASELQLHGQQSSIQVKGRVKFGDYQAPLEDIVGNVNRREQFITLGASHVGLLTESSQRQLQSLGESAELVGEQLQLSKNRLGQLSNWMDDTVELDRDLKTLVESLEDFDGIRLAEPSEGFQGNLRPYQQEGVNWLNFLDSYGFSGLLADDMGLGKTVQILAFLSRLNEGRILVVAPRSLLWHWHDEAQRFLPSLSVKVHHGAERDREELPESGLVITTYSTLLRDSDLFHQASFRVLVLDEAQQIKNPDSQSFKAVSRISADLKLSLSGTPVENHLGELWAQFRFLMPDLLPDRQSFQAQSLAAEVDSRHLKQIRKTIKPFLLRRKKEEVAPDLPPKTEQLVRIDMGGEQRQFYDDFLGSYKQKLLKKVDLEGMGKHRMEVLEAILRLRQICCHPYLVDASQDLQSAKLDAVMMDLETLVEAGEKALVYSQFTSMLQLIQKEVSQRGWKHVVLHGQSRDREASIQQFQNDPETQIFLISLKAGGTGLNLTAADAVLLFDPWWNEAAENQAIDRAHRIGQHHPIVAKRYIVADSIEERVLTLKQRKAQLAKELLDAEGEAMNFSAEDLLYLFS